MKASQKKKVEPETNERGQSVITTAYLKKLCEELELYETPRLNDQLFLHFKGFHKIENLEEYYNLKVIYLDHNLFSKIENLDVLSHLSTLYLQNNLITKVEGLENLTELNVLNLAHNLITNVDSLEPLINLNTLDLSHNQLATHQSLVGLRACPSLTNIDLSHNHISFEDSIMDIYSSLPNLACLHMQKNPACDQVVGYRKRLICAMPEAKYIDDRPVTVLERRMAQAWARGGKEEEAEEKKLYLEEKAKLNEKTGEEREKDEKARARMQLERERYERENISKREELLAQRELIIEEQPDDMIYKLKKIELQLERVEEQLKDLTQKQAVKLGQPRGITKHTSFVRTTNDKGEYVYSNNLSHDEVEQYLNKRNEEWNKRHGIVSDNMPVEDQLAGQQKDEEQKLVIASSQEDSGIVKHDQLPFSEYWTDELKGKLEELVEELEFDFSGVAGKFNDYLKQARILRSEDVSESEIRKVYTSIEIDKYRS